MVLLKVYSQSLSVFPFEGDAPRPVYVDRITLRPSMKRMEIEARLPQTLQRANRIKSVEPNECSTVKVASYPA